MWGHGWSKKKREEHEAWVKEEQARAIPRGDALHEILKVILGDQYHPDMIVRFTVRKQRGFCGLNVTMDQLTAPVVDDKCAIVRRISETTYKYEYLGLNNKGEQQ